MRTVLAMALLLGSCLPPSRGVPLAPKPPPPPATHGRLPLEMEPVAFLGVVMGIPAGTDVGAHHWGTYRRRGVSTPRPVERHVWGAEINVASDDFPFVGTKELRAAGYRVIGYRGDNPLFGIDDSTRARFQLAGTITELRYNTYADRDEGVVASVTIRWQLFDPLRREFVVDLNTFGRAEGRLVVHGRMVILNAVREAVRALAGQTRFEEVLKRKKAPTEATTDSLFVNACDAPELELPRDMEKALDAVVVVRVGAASGSGAIVSRDGYVLSAAHVVAGAREARVKLRMGEEIDAPVVRVNEAQDVALIKIGGTGRPCLRAAADERPAVGSDVYVLGAPLGEELAASVTKGVLSGSRRIEELDYLQTDASINPGNSGGPLLDPSGRVIGIASFKVVGHAVEGIGFGVPIPVATRSLTIRWR